MGISFAILIDLAMDIQNQLKASGRVNRGRMGVVIQEVTKELAETFGSARRRRPGQFRSRRADRRTRRGIAAGDVILRFDGKTIASSSDLPRVVGMTRPAPRYRSVSGARAQARRSIWWLPKCRRTTGRRRNRR